MFIVVTKEGFLTGKPKEEILKTDEIVLETDNPNWEDFIHGKRKLYEEINNNNINPIVYTGSGITTTTTKDNG